MRRSIPYTSMDASILFAQLRMYCPSIYFIYLCGIAPLFTLYISVVLTYGFDFYVEFGTFFVVRLLRLTVLFVKVKLKFHKLTAVITT
jgi:hypothetical protein